MRRHHFEISDREDMIRILNSCRIGRLATLDADGYPYITPVNFVFYQGCVYFHCALQGEKLDNLARDPRVGFEADHPFAYIEVGFNPERNSCRAHQFFQSVVIRGRARLLPDGDLKTAALNALLAKHENNEDFLPVTEDSPGYRTCHVVEVTPESMTGKKDLAQNKPQNGRREIAGRLVRRGGPGDLETVRAMGYDPDSLVSLQPGGRE